MQFQQAALLYSRTKFDFQDKELLYTINGETQMVRFAVPYQDIGVNKSIERFVEKGSRYFGLAILAAAFVGYIVTGQSHAASDLVFFVFTILGWGLLLFARLYARYDATKIPVSSKNNLIIIHDDQHQTIVDEIYKRRKLAFRQLYAEVDMLNHPEAEIKKFLWLKDQDIISPQEFSDARQKIVEASTIPLTMY